VAHPAPIDRVGEAQWDEAIATNLTSAFLITQGVVAGMRERRWGRLIFLSSVAAQVGGVVGPHYAASKAGLHGLMHFYAAHLAREGVTANAIAPALIETEMVTSNLKATPGIIPVGRFGDVDEVASVVRLLAENAYLTGQTINVNGGWYPS
jgi:3-oxoacyl-[acyl-carrier protein] reductase